MLRQADNKVRIEGILSEVDIKTGESKKDGKPYVMGEIKVKVTQDINGKTEHMEIPVNMFATKETKKGGLNPAYENIMKIKEEYTSIASCGNEDDASRIRIDRAEIGENAFWGNNGVLVSRPRIRASFSTRIKKDECQEAANFEAVIVIGNIKEEVRNDEPTGRLIVKGILVQYGERADVVDFIVASNDAINHIQTYWNEGDTVRIAGKVNFSSRVIHEEKEVGFGDPIIEDRTISVKELIITSGSQSALDGDLAYEADDIKEALKRRQATLDEQKENASKKEAAPAATEKKSTDFGF